MSRRFPRFVLSLGQFRGKNIIFTSLPFKKQVIYYVANFILYNLRGSSLHMKRHKALTQGTCPGDFRIARSFSSDLFFLYINFGKKNINFTSLPFKSLLTNSNTKSILYNLRGSALHMKRGSPNQSLYYITLKTYAN
jgi:hypothetical protein